MPDSLTEAQVEHVYDLLVMYAGARSGDEELTAFKAHWPECIEYRFGGVLGSGGKVWNSNGRIYVTCYPEDRTTERDATINAVNQRLARLVP